jgi:Retroviral aspartyl protease.
LNRGVVPSTYASPQLSIHSVLVTEINDHTMRAPITLIGERTKKTVDTMVLIDCGAGGTFISNDFARRRRIPLKPLPRPIKVNNVDGTPNEAGTTTHYVDSLATLHGRTFRIRWYATNLAHQDLILGLPWLRRANPVIDWQKGTLEWRTKPIPGHIDNFLPATITHFDKQPKPIAPLSTSIAVMCLMEDEEDETGEIPIVWINAKTTTSQLLAAQEQEKKEKKSIDDVLPEHYQQYRHLFEERTANQFPPSRPWDHKIDLKPGFNPRSSRVTNSPPPKIKNSRTSSMKTSDLDAYAHLNPRWDRHFSLLPRRTENSDPVKITDTLTNGPFPTHTLYPERINSWTDYKDRSTSPNSTSDGDTTTSESEKETSGRLRSRQIADSTNPPSCSSECGIPQQRSRT